MDLVSEINVYIILLYYNLSLAALSYSNYQAFPDYNQKSLNIYS